MKLLTLICLILEDGKNYVMFDYKVGGSIVIKNIADDFRGIYKQDYNRIPIEQLANYGGSI